MKIKSSILFIILSFLLFTSAQAKDTSDIVVTIKPLHSLVQNVLGTTGQAQILLTQTASPHDFQLKPSHIKQIQKAKVVFFIDGKFETFLSRAFKTLPKNVRKAGIIDNADLTFLPYRKGGVWEGHDHDHHGHGNHDDHKKEAKDEHDHGHDHGKKKHKKDHHKEHGHDDHHSKHGHDKHKKEEAHHDEAAETPDMHVWLDPKNAKKIVQFIAKELSTIYPKNAKTYQKNAEATIKKLEVLDTKLKVSLKDIKDRPFIVFHDAYQYFEQAYGLSGVGSITLEPDEAPSPKRISNLRKKIKGAKAACVFREPQYSDRLVKTVIEGTKAKSATLDPLGANLTDGTDLYFNLLNDLSNNLSKCLSPSS
ncbi:MAG: zinc ABC transporter substrate-binding protein [Pseudomonadota bacterium]